jgi:hypothetical protein
VAEALRCTNCGIRRLVALVVLGDDGNPVAADDVRWCMGCNRIFKVVEDGDDKVKLKQVVANTNMMSLREL